MKNYVSRHIEGEIKIALSTMPVTAIIGPRQCGKSTLSKYLLESLGETIYLDLERPSDLQKLNDAEWFLSSHKEKLICIDEIQRKPDLFPLLRSLSDEWNEPGKFLVLGSASRDLLRQSSESLAGRISYKRLTPFLSSEIADNISLETYLIRGGFPKSVLARDETTSTQWREDFITTFLERDLLQWKGFSSGTMRRLWQMLAHVNGQTVNYSLLGKSLGVSNVTIRNYIDLLEATFMLDVILPYHSNMGKRLVKSPKVYISDSGITSALLHLNSFSELYSHPVFGSIWEQVILSNLKGHFPDAQIFFYRTSGGAELDFIMHYKNKLLAIECKASQSPKPTKGFYSAIEDIQPDHTFIASPIKEGWAMSKAIDVVAISEMVEKIRKF